MSLRQPVQLQPYRGHVLVTPPAVEPVTLNSVKATLSLEGTCDDEMIMEFISAARTYIEEVTGLAMISQVWLLSLDRWPSGQEPWWDGWRQGSRMELTGPGSWGPLVMPRYPLQSVDDVETFNETGNGTMVNIGATFDVDVYQRPGRVSLKQGATWPIAMRSTDAIRMTYTAGYGDAAASVPAPLRTAVRQMALYLYTHRGDGCDVGSAYRDSGAAGMADAYKVARL